MNKAREKMAFIPEGSTFIKNEVSKVPGFAINNVYCLAGVPDIMESMLNSIIPFLEHGKVVRSYPFTREGIHGTSLVLRSSDYVNLEAAFLDLKNLIKE